MRTGGAVPEVIAKSAPVSAAPGMVLGARPPPDVTTSVGAHQPQVAPPSAQPQQPQHVAPQPAVVSQPPVRAMNHVVPEPETESGEDNSRGDEKEDELTDFEDHHQPEKPPQQQQHAEPGMFESCLKTK